MIYKLVLKPRAENDLTESIEWYEKQQKGLGKRFIDQVEVYFDKIQKGPFNFQIKRATFREAYLKKFPNIIIFEFTETEVVVYSVFNVFRNPKQKS